MQEWTLLLVHAEWPLTQFWILLFTMKVIVSLRSNTKYCAHGWILSSCWQNTFRLLSEALCRAFGLLRFPFICNCLIREISSQQWSDRYYPTKGFPNRHQWDYGAYIFHLCHCAECFKPGPFTHSYFSWHQECLWLSFIADMLQYIQSPSPN